MLPNALNGLSFVERFYPLGKIDSTNNFAKKLKSLPAFGMYIIQADVQENGRGRLEKAFFSNTAGGLWVSIIVPIEELSSHFIYNRSISVAICKSILELYPQSPVRVKWPNDIYWNDRKIAGILLESLPFSDKHLIIGFGLNVNIPIDSFPLPLKHSASSLLIETKSRISTRFLLKRIIEKFDLYCNSDPSEVHDLYLELLYRKGYRVSIEGVEGILSSVTEHGELSVLTDCGPRYFISGTLEFIQIGES